MIKKNDNFKENSHIFYYSCIKNEKILSKIGYIMFFLKIRRIIDT